MATQEQRGPSTSTPDVTAGGDILERLSKEAEKHRIVRETMTPAGPVGRKEQMLIDAHDEIVRLRDAPRSELGQKDAARLDWLQKVKNVKFEAVNQQAVEISRIAIFTTASQRITGRNVREVIDDAMQESAERPSEG